MNENSVTRQSDEKKYWAFVSYSSKDKKWGKWLHKRLENYSIPSQYQGLQLCDGTKLGKHLRPVFRDRDELSSSSELGIVIEEALKQSRFLIVLCSPNSAASEWVNKEIEDFRKIHGAGRVLALIVEGEPNASANPNIDNDLECFPPALRYPLEPLAGDLRAEADGKQRGFLKILAGMADIGFDDLFRRHERAQRKRRIVLGTVASIFIAVLAGLSIFALTQKSIAEAQTVIAKEQMEEAEKAKLQAIAAQRETGEALSSSSFVVANMRAKEGRVGVALELLESIPEQHRQVEWHMSKREISGSDMTLVGHSDAVDSVAFSADGGLIASASRDSSIRLWDATTGNQIDQLTSKSSGVAALDFSPDGKCLASIDDTGRLTLWDIKTRSQSKVQLFQDLANSNGSAIKFSPDGSTLVCGSLAQGIVIWHFLEADSAPIKVDPIPESGAWPKIEFRPDGKTFFVSSLYQIYSFNSQSGQNPKLIYKEPDLQTKPHSHEERNQGMPFGFSINPNNAEFSHVTNLFSGEDHIRQIEFESGESNYIEETSLTGGQIGQIQYGPSGDQLCAVGGNSIRIWKLRQRSHLDLVGHRARINSIAFHPAGHRLVSADENGEIKVWDAFAGKQRFHFYASSYPIECLEFSPDGTRLVTSSRNGRSIFELPSMDSVTIPNSNYRTDEEVRFSPNGKSFYATCSDKQTEIEDQAAYNLVEFDSASGEEIATLVRAISFRESISVGFDRAVVYEHRDQHSETALPARLYDTVSGEEIAILKANNDANNAWVTEKVFFFPDGERFLTSESFPEFESEPKSESEYFSKKRMRLWDRTGTLLNEFAGDVAADAVCFSPDNTTMATFVGSFDDFEGDLWICNTEDFKFQRLKKVLVDKQFFSGHQRWDLGMAFDPSGKRLAIGEEEGITILDIESGEELMSLNAYESPSSVCWNRNSKLLAASFSDGSVKIWNTSSGPDSNLIGGQLPKFQVVPFTHADLADQAQSSSLLDSSNTFSSLFHRACVMSDDPDQALAWDLLHDAFDRWKSYEANQSITLPPIVKQMLLLPRGKSQPISLSGSKRLHDQLLELLSNREFKATNIRPRFDQSILEIAGDQNKDCQTTLAMLHYRLGCFQTAITAIEEATSGSDELHPVQHGLLSLCYSELDQGDMAKKHGARFDQLMADWGNRQEDKQLARTRGHWNFELSNRFHAEFKGLPEDKNTTGLGSKQSRGLGLTPTIWPERSSKQLRRGNSISGGGIF